MQRHYLFASNYQISVEEFEEYILESGKNMRIEYIDPTHALVIGESIDVYLSSTLPDFACDLGLKFGLLAGFDEDRYHVSFVDEALAFYPNMLTFPSDIILKQMSFGNYACLSYVRKLFDGLDKEIKETVGEYLRMGMDGIKASERLGIHRNTFNYRLSSFIKETGVDIRDYHNALLLEIYFQFAD